MHAGSIDHLSDLLLERRRFAIRYDGTASSLLGFVLLGCIRIWIRFAHGAAAL